MTANFASGTVETRVPAGLKEDFLVTELGAHSSNTHVPRNSVERLSVYHPYYAQWP